MKKILLNSTFLVLTASLVLVLTLIYFWRGHTFVPFTLAFINNSQIIDIPGADKYISIRAIDDIFVGGKDLKPFSSSDSFQESSAGIDFGWSNSVYTQTIPEKNKDEGHAISRTAIMQRIDAKNIKFSYKLQQSQKLTDKLGYWIVLGSTTDILKFSAEGSEPGFAKASFSTGGCDLLMSELSGSDQQKIKFTTTDSIPRAVLIEIDYAQQMTVEFNMTIDCQ